MRDVLCSVPSLLMLTFGAYLLGLFLQRKSGWTLLHPFLICIPVLVATLCILDIPYDTYSQANQAITFLLGPSVVALALSLYEEIDTIRRNALPITVAVLVGALVGIASVYVSCKMLHLDGMWVRSLEAKSVTTPIAMDITRSLGGNESLSAVSVIITGFLGSLIGPFVLRLCHITNPVAKGLAMGCSAHGLGTARAIELGALEGAVSGLCIALMGVATAILVPLFHIVLPVW